MSDISSSAKKKRPPKLLPFNNGTGNSQVDVDDNHSMINCPTSNSGGCKLDSSVSIDIGDLKAVHINPDSLETVQHLGRGQYGIVEKVIHKESGHQLAVKRVAIQKVGDDERSRLLMDVDILVKGTECENIIKFFGALIWEGHLWILMELMDCSLDKFYKLAHSNFPKLDCLIEADTTNPIPETALGRIAADVVNALNYLYSIKVIHRDIKPSNILINKAGVIKLCDFGISGYLLNSIACTYEAGCRPYMAPERIDPKKNQSGYDIRSDVWSFGITMFEIATGRYPYGQTRDYFEQIKSICVNPPPTLPKNKFSQTFEGFISLCLQKDPQLRPKYDVLIAHKFIGDNKNLDISEFSRQVISSADISR